MPRVDLKELMMKSQSSYTQIKSIQIHSNEKQQHSPNNWQARNSAPSRFTETRTESSQSEFGGGSGRDKPNQVQVQISQRQANNNFASIKNNYKPESYTVNSYKPKTDAIQNYSPVYDGQSGDIYQMQHRLSYGKGLQIFNEQADGMSFYLFENLFLLLNSKYIMMQTIYSIVVYVIACKIIYYSIFNNLF